MARPVGISEPILRAMNKGLTKEKMAELLQVEYASYTEIAKMYGVSKDAITRMRKDYGLPEPLPRPVDTITPQKVKLLFDQGLIDKDIAEQVGISIYQVIRIRNKHGMSRKIVQFKKEVQNESHDFL